MTLILCFLSLTHGNMHLHLAVLLTNFINFSFFQIELPKYTSYEILRDKLRYAITNCQAIDTDGRAYDIWDEED